MIKRVSNKEFLEFNKVFGLLLFSKLQIIDALSLITKQTKNQYFKEILTSAIRDITNGKTLSESFAKYPKVFPEDYLANLKIAEETGDISGILTEYTQYLEKFYNLKKKISQAARYPLFVLVISVAVVLFMLVFLIPTFETLFTSVKVTIPPITAFLLYLSEILFEYSYYILGGLVLFGYLIYSLVKNKHIKENILDVVIYKVPLANKIFKINLLARFSLSMSILLKSGVTLLDGLKISKKISNNSIYQKELNLVIKKIVKGEAFSNNLQKSVLFDLTFTKLLSAGEESAELSEVFSLISNFYSQEFDYKIENLKSLIEPILILFVGSIVAVILIALYLPIFEIMNSVGM
ncbi:MAG: type II secretion system F family protein [bacterium]